MKPYKISVEQAKLLGNALRVKILAVLADDAKTSKQVATELGHSPGNVHYHIQQLHQGGLLELVEKKQVGGVVEKYYKAVATQFEPEEKHTMPFQTEQSTKVSTSLLLTEDEMNEFHQEMLTIFEKWEKRKPQDQANEVGVELLYWKQGEK